MDTSPTSKLEKRKKHLESIVDGDVPDVLASYIRHSMKPKLAENQQSRLESALTDTISVFPNSQGIYDCFSRDSGKQYGITLDPYSCTCSDFILRCDYTEGEICKHILKIQAMIHINALPSDTVYPNLWTEACLNEDIIHAKQDNYNYLADRLEYIKSQMEQMNWYDIKYMRIYSAWYQTLNNQL